LGWKTTFSKPNSWIQYNTVNFGKTPLKTVTVKAMSESGGTLEIHVNSISGPVLAEVKIGASKDWKNVKAPVRKFEGGVRNLFVVMKGGERVEADWVRFE
jgi:hypothetical protein